MDDHKLRIILDAKNDTQRAFMQVQGNLKTFQTKTEIAFLKAGGYIKSFTSRIFSMQGALAGVAGAVGIGLFIDKSLKAADTIGKTADRIGIGTGALQEYRYAAGLAGVETAQLDKGIEKFTKNLGEARTGTGTLVTFLKKYDEQLLANLQHAKSTDDALNIIYNAMGKAADSADRAALANAAFGRSGIAMTVMVKDGAAALAQLRQEARDLGIVMSDDMIRNAEKANDEMSKLTQVVKIQFMNAVVGLAPEIAKVAEQTTNWWKANQNLVKAEVAEYAVKIKDALADIWKLVSYDPAILEWGIVGLAIGGKKWGVVVGGTAHMVKWVENLSKALAMASQGIVEYSEIAKANFKELEDIVAKGEARMQPGQSIRVTPGTSGYDIFKPSPKAPVPIVAPPAPEPVNWSKYWNTQQGKIEMSKALSIAGKGITELNLDGQTRLKYIYDNAHEEWRIRGRYQDATAADVAKSEKAMADFRMSGLKASEDAYAAMYDTLKFDAEGYYRYRVSQIKKETDAYAEATGDQVLAHQVFVEKVKQLDQERAESAKETNGYMIEFSQRTAEAMEQNFSDFFFDVFTGKFDSLQDYIIGILRSIQRASADILGQMTKDWLFGATGSGGAFKSGLSWLFSGISGFYGGGMNTGAPTHIGAGGTSAFGMAGGGKFKKDEWHVVGEKGPELIYTGDKSGTVIPNDQAQNILQNFNMPSLPAAARASSGSASNITLNVPVTVNAGGDIPSQARLSGRLQEAVENTVMRILREEIR